MRRRGIDGRGVEEEAGAGLAVFPYGRGPLRSPGFPVGFRGFGELHVLFLVEGRPGCRIPCYVAGNLASGNG
jgi:hypothetical protein